MELTHDFLVEDREFSSYEDLKAHCRLKAPENFNFAYDVVDKYAKLAPNKRALVWCNDNGEEKTFTFAQISAASKQTAYFLTAHNIKKGDAVMLILRRRYEYWLFTLALHRIGAIVIPATEQLLEKDIVYRNNAAGVKMIVACDNKVLLDEIDKAKIKSETLQTLVTVGEKRENWVSYHDEIEKYAPEFPRPQGELATHNEDPMLIYFTSGTSGYPKMVLHNFLYPLGHIITAKYWQQVVDDGLHLTVAETGWAKCSWGKIYGQWIAGSGIFVYDMASFHPDRMLSNIAKYGVTTFCAPPTVYRYLVRQDLSKYDFSSLKYCCTAGEALNGEVYNKFYEQTGLKMHEGFGQSESTVIVANFPGIKVKPGSMGKPSPCYDVDIVDINGKSCPVGETGELVINIKEEHPFGLFVGYYHDVSLTAAAFDSGVYHTGDTVYRDDEGYIWFVGRKDDIIKSSGYRISPFEVESVLQQHPAVMECAVTGVEDPKRGQVVKATIVLSPGYEASHALEVELFDFVKHETALYKSPRIIEFVKELPKTFSGKIRRVEIREKDKGTETANIKQDF